MLGYLLRFARNAGWLVKRLKKLWRQRNRMRKLAHIETIREIIPHGNAENLEIAKVLGWTCVVLKGQFQAEQQIVFVEPDAILKEGRSEWEFMRARGFRVKTIRLRKVISQ